MGGGVALAGGGELRAGVRGGAGVGTCSQHSKLARAQDVVESTPDGQSAQVCRCAGLEAGRIKGLDRPDVGQGPRWLERSSAWSRSPARTESRERRSA